MTLTLTVTDCNYDGDRNGGGDDGGGSDNSTLPLYPQAPTPSASISSPVPPRSQKVKCYRFAVV